MKLEAKQRLQSTELIAAIPLSIYRKAVSNIHMNNPQLYADIFNKYGSGNNPKNKNRIYIPVGSAPVSDNQVTKPNEQVLNYLQEKNYQLDNYMLGTAFMPDGKRTIKIGKLLSNQPELKKLFDNDPSRRAARKVEGKLLVVISKHPYDILGASFDRGWTSCVNLQDGGNAKPFKKSIQHGLLVAYLVKSDDKNINKPVARILIRPYFMGANVVVDPDGEEYGTAPAGFRRVVEKFTDWVNTGSPKGKYTAPKGMYLDQAPKELLHKVDVDSIKSAKDVAMIRDPALLNELAASR